MKNKVITNNFRTIEHALAFWRENDVIDDGGVAFGKAIAAGDIVIGAAGLEGKLFHWQEDGRATYYEFC